MKTKDDPDIWIIHQEAAEVDARKVSEAGISEYVIGEVFIEKMIKHESWDALRAYAYYKRMLEK